MALLFGLATCSVGAFASPSAHPRLIDLPDNTAVDLGPYECESRVPDLNCATIFDYSRFNYDPVNHRMLAFGGGHAASGRTDVDVFDLASLSWHSLYPSMSCAEIETGDIDPRGFHRSSGHPVARHTYDQTVVAVRNEGSWLLMFSTEGFSGRCHKYNSPIKSVARLRLDSHTKTWAYSAELKTPWGYAGSAEFDPVSGMVVLLGGQSRGLWVYDPVSEKLVASMQHFDRAKNSSNLIYDPKGDRMYLIDRETMHIRQLLLDRNDWSETKESVIAPRGDLPPPMRNFAYDSHNHVIGGIHEGVFHAFDLSDLTWYSHKVKERSDSGARIGTVVHHAIDYDPLNNVFILVTDRTSGRRTWAYRYRN